MKAIWSGQVIAQSEQTILIEGNHYFPATSVNFELLIASDYQTNCQWKGTAHYYSVKLGQHLNQDAAWYYPEPKSAAQDIRGYLAFWRGVEVVISQ